jgi:cellulose synthase/poly-beta-1,6-N-acetylglucosamine synthase-like glycosyltransferase
MILLSIIFALGYCTLILWFLRGWIQLKQVPPFNQTPQIKFSIIIPARNEENNMINTIDDLIQQNYPPDLFEIIIINDDSTDQTYKIAFDYLDHIQNKTLDIKLINLSKVTYSSGHKKHAIEYGINHSKFDWIITTDADCRRGKNWLRSIAGYILQHDPVLVSAPVLFHNENTFFEKIQSIEFLSLIGIGAASIGNSSPNLCNGANLAYKKSAFIEVDGFNDNLNLSSGDDEFLLHKIAAKYPGKIGFQKDKDAIVYTNAIISLTDFIRQRKRWVSKSTKYRKKEVFLILLFVYLFHLMILATALLSIFYGSYFLIFVFLFLSKLIAESILVIPLSRYFGKLRFMLWYPFAALFYVVYVICIGIVGNSGSYTWKGRQVK